MGSLPPGSLDPFHSSKFHVFRAPLARKIRAGANIAQIGPLNIPLAPSSQVK